MGAFEWGVILVIVLLLFGAKKIPELAKSMGKATREFKDAKSAFNDALVEDDIPAPTQPNIAPPLEESSSEKAPQEKSTTETESK